MLLVNLASIFVVVFGHYLFEERFTKSFLFGICCAFLSVFILLGNSLTITRSHLLGDSFNLLAAFFATYLIMVAQAEKRIYYCHRNDLEWFCCMF